ncbi:MAG: hypothetical protein AB7P52_12960 [Alphaproteobacteria bacterium]
MIPTAALLGLACSTLVACETVMRQAWVEVSEPAESEALVALPSSWGGGDAGLRVRFHDRSEIEEYAAYEAAGARAELFHAATIDDRYALEDGLNIEKALDLFAYPSGRVHALGPSAAVEVGRASVFHRRFEIAAEQRACIGLKAAWDEVSYDPRHRPARLLVGYYCAAPNVALDDASIERLVGDLRIKPPPDAAPRDTPEAARDALFRRARGDDTEAARGVPDFPLRLARRYQDEDGTDAPDLAH